MDNLRLAGTDRTEPSSCPPQAVGRLVWAVVSVLLACGCGVPSATVSPTVQAGNGALSRSHGGVACIDSTTSVPTAFGERAQGWFANYVTRAVTAPSGPALYYLRATRAASYSDSAGLVSVSLPAVPAPPDPPVPQTNPYETAREEELQRAYAAQLSAQQAEVEKVRQLAIRGAAEIRAAKLPPDDRGTDILGCEIKAGDLLGNLDDRVLFVATDLIPNGPQQQLPSGALGGVAVVLTQWCDDNAVTCRGRRNTFEADVRRAGATSFTVIDPQQLG